MIGGVTCYLSRNCKAEGLVYLMSLFHMKSGEKEEKKKRD